MSATNWTIHDDLADAHVARFAKIVAAFFVVLTVLSWTTSDRVKYVYLATGRVDLPARTMAVLTIPDFALLALLIGFGVAAMVTGARQQAAVRLCAGAHPVWHWAVTGAALLWSGHAILSPGLIVVGDAGTHVARVSHLSAAILGGDSLYWDNYFFGGSTLLQFTGPIFHWFSTAITLLIGDATTAIKISVSLARALAAWFMYLLVRRLGVGRPAACLAALFYGGGFPLTYMESVRASFPQLVNFATMPAVLYGIECLHPHPRVFGAATAALALAGICLIGNHQPTAMIFTVYVVLFVAARMVMNTSRILAIPALLAAAGATLLGSCFFLLPFALERGMTADNFSTAGLISLAAPSMAALRNSLLWGGAGHGAEYSAYLGWPMLLCVLAGAVVMARQSIRTWDDRHRIWLLFLILAALSLFVRGAYVRHHAFTLLFLAVAGAIGADLLLRHYPNRRGLALALFALTLIDGVPLAVQPWTRSDMYEIVRAGEALAHRAADARVLEVWYQNQQPEVSVGPDNSPIHYARVQMLSGPHKQDATPAHNAGAAVLMVAANDLLAHGRMSDATHALLATYNIGWVIGTGATRPGLPPGYRDVLPDPVIGAHWRVPEATPFLVAARLEQVLPPESFMTAPFWTTTFAAGTEATTQAMEAVRSIQDRMAPDLATRQARALLVPILPVGDAWQSASTHAPTVRQLAYQVQPGRVRLMVDADGAGFIRLVHPMAASITVTRDGAPVPAVADVMSLMVLPLHQGVNDFVIEAHPSRLRIVCLWISIVTVLSLGLWLARHARRLR